MTNNYFKVRGGRFQTFYFFDHNDLGSTSAAYSAADKATRRGDTICAMYQIPVKGQWSSIQVVVENWKRDADKYASRAAE